MAFSPDCNNVVSIEIKLKFVCSEDVVKKSINVNEFHNLEVYLDKCERCPLNCRSQHSNKLTRQT